MKKANASSLTNDPAAFAAWAKMSNPTGMTANDVKSYIASQGIFIRPQGSTSNRGPLQVGEVVTVDAKNCTNPFNKKVCNLLNYDKEAPIFCVITSIQKPSDLRELCTIEVAPINAKGGTGNSFSLKAALPVKIKALQKKLDKATNSGDIEEQKKILGVLRDKALSPHKGVGLYRAFRSIDQYMGSLKKAPLFVVVYDKGGKAPSPQVRRDLTKRMLLEREKKTTLHGNFQDLFEGELDSYSVLYYEGNLVSAGHNKSGQFVLTLNESDGRSYTAMNPELGKIYYISTQEDMPSEDVWVREFKERLNDTVNSEVKK